VLVKNFEFAAICTMMDRAKQAIYTTPYAVVNELRRYRMDVVKTIGQYRMIYEVMTFWMTLPSGEEGKAEE
jgi:protein tyrosine phosphatase